MIAPQVQAQLRRFDDKTLQVLLHSNSPDVPAFYVLAELNRRNTIRKASPVSVPDQTVADSVDAQTPTAQTFAEGGGVRRKPDEAPFIYSNAAGPLSALVNGGIYLWRNGLPLGEKHPQTAAPLRLAPAEDNRPTPDTADDGSAAIAAGIASACPSLTYDPVKLSRVDETVPDAFQFKDRSAERRDAIAKDRADLELQRKRDWNNVLMQGGVAMAAGRSPDFITNAAQGFQSGLNRYNELSDGRRKTADTLTAQERSLDQDAELVRYKNDVAARAVAAQRANVGKANTDISNREAEFNASNRQSVNLVNMKQHGDRALMQMRALAKSPGKLPAGMATAAKVLVADYTERLKNAKDDPETQAGLYSNMIKQWESLKNQFLKGADPATHPGLQILPQQ